MTGQKTGLFLDHRDNRQTLGAVYGGPTRAQLVQLYRRVFTLRAPGAEPRT